jgi:hypothetical protein
MTLEQLKVAPRQGKQNIRWIITMLRTELKACVLCVPLLQKGVLNGMCFDSGSKKNDYFLTSFTTNVQLCFYSSISLPLWLLDWELEIHFSYPWKYDVLEITGRCDRVLTENQLVREHFGLGPDFRWLLTPALLCFLFIITPTKLGHSVVNSDQVLNKSC